MHAEAIRSEEDVRVLARYLARLAARALLVERGCSLAFVWSARSDELYDALAGDTETLRNICARTPIHRTPDDLSWPDPQETLDKWRREWPHIEPAPIEVLKLR